MIKLSYFTEVFSLLFVIIDPPGIIPIFLALTHDKSYAFKRRVALRACLVALIILVIFGMCGDFILDQLHISEPAFRIAGGILLLLTAIDMVTAHHLGFSTAINSDDQDSIQQKNDISIFPLAIPLIAGPGSMVSIIILMRKAEYDYSSQFTIFLSLTATLAVMYLFLISSTRISHLIGTTGANVLTRIFGIILAAIAVQFITVGINDMMIIPFLKTCP